MLAITTSFSGCARLCDAMGERSQLPPILGRRGRRAVLPPVALVATGVLAIGFLVVGAVFGSSEEVLTLASLYSFGILISLMLANASIAWLRWTEPDMPRAVHACAATSPCRGGRSRCRPCSARSARSPCG